MINLLLPNNTNCAVLRIYSELGEMKYTVECFNFIGELISTFTVYANSLVDTENFDQQLKLAMRDIGLSVASYGLYHTHVRIDYNRS